MQNAFEILDGFLERTEPEVEGRALQEPPETIKWKLRNFARGALAPGEQAELLGKLKENRHWLLLLAQEVKMLRPGNQAGRKDS
ncbi:MAG: hypothetical protein ABSH48_18650 [Verrucomicrobiota bacterium]|jgi:hypothetical protein